jgi:hypothetical protein
MGNATAKFRRRRQATSQVPGYGNPATSSGNGQRLLGRRQFSARPARGQDPGNIRDCSDR